MLHFTLKTEFGELRFKLNEKIKTVSVFLQDEQTGEELDTLLSRDEFIKLYGKVEAIAENI